MKIGFDNEKYLKIQSEHIKERISQFDGKLYLELGGKLFDDHHASRVLPGFQPDSKLRMFQKISDSIEIVIVISAADIEKNKKRADLGITYDEDVLRLRGELDVKVIGRGAHAGLPHEGVDSLLIACSLINEYQHILTRMKTPFHPAIMNIGEIHGGTARNSVAKETEFHGTVRCYSDEMFAHLTDSIGRINKGFEEAYGCQIEWSCPPFYPAVINDKKLFNYVSSITSLKELDESLMLAEDFSFYQKEVKGLFIFVGTKTKEFQSGLHTGTFNFNESVLQSVVDMYMKIILNYQEE